MTDACGDGDAKTVLQQSIERSEEELRDAVEELAAAVKSDVVLRNRIVDRPWMWLLGGFVAGVWLSRR